MDILAEEEQVFINSLDFEIAVINNKIFWGRYIWLSLVCLILSLNYVSITKAESYPVAFYTTAKILRSCIVMSISSASASIDSYVPVH